MEIVSCISLIDNQVIIRLRFVEKVTPGGKTRDERREKEISKSEGTFFFHIDVWHNKKI